MICAKHGPQFRVCRPCEQEAREARKATNITTTVAGVTLTRNKDHAMAEWHCTIGGEAWRLYQKDDRTWQGFTADKLTGTPRLATLTLVIGWIQDHQAEIAGKLAVRRAAGTRMVDPAPSCEIARCLPPAHGLDVCGKPATYRAELPLGSKLACLDCAHRLTVAGVSVSKLVDPA